MVRKVTSSRLRAVLMGLFVGLVLVVVGNWPITQLSAAPPLMISQLNALTPSQTALNNLIATGAPACLQKDAKLSANGLNTDNTTLTVSESGKFVSTATKEIVPNIEELVFPLSVGITGVIGAKSKGLPDGLYIFRLVSQTQMVGIFPVVIPGEYLGDYIDCQSGTRILEERYHKVGTYSRWGHGTSYRESGNFIIFCWEVEVGIQDCMVIIVTRG